MSLEEYELKITPMDGKYTNLINALGVPKIFPNTQDRNLSCVILNHKFTKQLQLTDNSQGEANVDILIGADLYWKFVTGETKRSNTCNLVAIKSIFGWLISGPNECNHQIHQSSVETTMLHLLKISCRENHNYLNKEIHRFKNLDAIGISPNESSVYEKFENNIKFKDNRYSVNLPIKDYHPLLPDNYELSLKRLHQLRERLVKDEMVLKL